MSSPKYRFYPTLLDAFTRYAYEPFEDYFYLDAAGKWHRNYNEQTGELRYSEEEVDAMRLQELLDTINRVDGEVSEAASKGTAFNEIVDCIAAGRPSSRHDITIASARDFGELVEKLGEPPVAKGFENIADRLSVPFIFASIDGFGFFFDPNLCRRVASDMQWALPQYYTSARIDTAYGGVRLYGYIDELIMNRVVDIKTTKRYEFGKYAKYWQRHVYPYCLIESGDCTEIKEFEFYVVKLSGGTAKTPLISGEIYKEVYTYDHAASTEAIRQQCERFIEFIEAHRYEITDKRIFGEI